MPSTRGRSRARSDGPTKEELYRQAQRFRIEGRSKMNKPELERAVERRKGMGAGGSRSRGSGPQAPAHPVEVQRFLEGVGYPTRKDRLVEEARSRGASRDVRETIERLPERRFESPIEVSEAIGSLR